MKTTLVLYSLLVLRTSPAFAADSAWAGTWKLDETRSHFTGETVTYSKAAGNLLHFSDGSTTNFDFAVDGKEYPTWANRRTTWTATGSNAWDMVSRASGKVLAKGHGELSADGRTLKETWTGTRPDGSAFQEEFVWTRVSRGDGLIGTWRSTRVAGAGGPQQFVISVPAPGVVHYEVPDMQVAVEGRTDGSDNPLTGPTMPPGTTLSFKALSPTSTRYVMKVNGKADNMGEQTIAADGRSFSDVHWNAGKENEKTTGVYVKQ